MIGPYKVVKLIGEGGMGHVYQAHDTVLERDVGVKLISREALRGNEEALKRFLAEGKLTARIRNRHVVEVHGLGTDKEGNPYLVMELLHGRTLRQALMAREPFPLSRIVDIGTQILTALVAAHEHVVHRDLKPPNIFLTRDDEGKDFVKVLDFGIAKALSEATADLTGQGMIVGTPAYTAPEVVLGVRERRDPRQDLYGVGVMLYEMTTGRSPWPLMENRAIYTALLTGKRPRRLREVVPEINAAFADIVDKAMAISADDRYQSAAEFRAALRSVESTVVSTEPVAETTPDRPVEAVGSPPALEVPSPARAAAPTPPANDDDESTEVHRKRVAIAALAEKAGQAAAVEVSGPRVWRGRAHSTEYAAHRLRRQ
jgi:serine/threonine-protein kinase